ncbi:MAG: fibronectin type III domain-containing protein [Ruminococcaceae bacterium]|nr:fibronectin type III domain-containing protein [Oscillospiraceae bacterium]
MKKKLASIVLAAVMLLASTGVPFFAFAKSTTPVWDKYSKSGTHKVSTLTFTLDSNDFTYKVWYPSDIADMSKRPVILYCNGTGSNYEKSPETAVFLKKAASYGFICLTNTDQNTGTGVSMDAGMTALIGFNGNKKHKFYNKINIDKVGLAGHSQGATCCLNLASKGKYENSKHFKTIFACSLPTPELEASPIQNCPYDASLVSLPTLMLAGTGSTDATFIAPLETSLLPAFSKIKSDVYLARMKGVEHADSIYKTHPYMIAWFEYRLNSDKTAAKAFIGKSPELKTNKAWQDFKRKVKVNNTTLTKVTAVSKGFNAYWKKAAGVTGYQVQYSTSKKFTAKTTKSVFVAKQSATGKAVKKLSAAKVYCVRVRTYRTVGGVKYYGKWTAVKSIKTKK